MNCPKCKREMKRVRNLNELPAYPYSWWKYGDKLFEEKVIFYCSKCRFWKTLTKLEEVRYNISRMIGGELV